MIFGDRIIIKSRRPRANIFPLLPKVVFAPGQSFTPADVGAAIGKPGITVAGWQGYGVTLDFNDPDFTSAGTGFAIINFEYLGEPVNVMAVFNLDPYCYVYPLTLQFGICPLTDYVGVYASDTWEIAPSTRVGTWGDGNGGGWAAAGGGLGDGVLKVSSDGYSAWVNNNRVQTGVAARLKFNTAVESQLAIGRTYGRNLLIESFGFGAIVLVPSLPNLWAATSVLGPLDGALAWISGGNLCLGITIPGVATRYSIGQAQGLGNVADYVLSPGCPLYKSFDIPVNRPMAAATPAIGPEMNLVTAALGTFAPVGGRNVDGAFPYEGGVTLPGLSDPYDLVATYSFVDGTQWEINIKINSGLAPFQNVYEVRMWGNASGNVWTANAVTLDNYEILNQVGAEGVIARDAVGFGAGNWPSVATGAPYNPGVPALTLTYLLPEPNFPVP